MGSTVSSPIVASRVNGRQTLDEVMYLASLVSETGAISLLLDPVRRITAKLKPEEPVSAEDQTVLRRVSRQLEQYLTTQEKIRSFTPEQLKKQVTDFQRGVQPNPFWQAIQVTGIVTVALIVLIFVLPLPLSAATRGLTASSIFFMMVHLAAAWFFVSALRTFAPQLRRAYALIAGGVVILGLTQIVQPVIQVLDLQSTPYNTLFSVLPLIPGYMLMYGGARRFSHHIGRQSRLLEPLSLIVCLLIVIPFGLFFPHTNSVVAEQLLDVIFTLQIINITLVVFFTALLGRILGYLSARYAPPVRLVLVFAVVSFGIGVYMWIVNALTGGLPEQPMLIPLIIAIMINGFLLLRAGYDFNRASA